MIRWLLWMLGGILLGGIVHLATVLAMPQAATQDAYSRLVPLTPVNAMVPLAAPAAQTSVMPFMDPAFAAAVCRYDLSGGTIKLNAPVSKPTPRSRSTRAAASPITRSTTAPQAGGRSSSI